MMLAWMLATIAIAAAFGVAGLLAEHGLSALGWPRRWLWVFVIVASVVWPFASGPLTDLAARGSGDVAVAAIPSAPTGTAARWIAAPAELAGVPPTLLVGVWLALSTLLVLVLFLSVVALREDRRRWHRGTVAGEDVFLSGWVGPAVVGVVRPWIVLPGWVVGMPEQLQRLIVLHEREHVRAGDSRLVAAGLLSLVLLPWCLPLWWHFHRLRSAVEADCDARLLRAGTPPRDYAELLLAVARRRRRTLLPLVAIAPSKGSLERRIRSIVAGSPSGRRRSAYALMAAAALLVPLVAAAISVPRPPSPGAIKTTLLLSLAANESVRSDGSLRGDPGDARIDAAIREHHAGAIASGLPDGSVIWFVADRHGAVVRTGIDSGTEREVMASVRARYPHLTSDFSLAWIGVPAAGDPETQVVWMLPPR